MIKSRERHEAIVEKDKAEYVTDSLNKKVYQNTIIFSTGGFLKKGNAILTICTENDHLQEVVKIMKTVCGKKTMVEVNVPDAEMPQGVLATPIWMGGIT